MTHGPALTRDEINDGLTKVADYAQTIGLYGVLILSPRCPDCGKCHDFGMSADAVGEEGNPEIRQLLLRFADVARDVEPELIEKHLPRNRQ